MLNVGVIGIGNCGKQVASKAMEELKIDDWQNAESERKELLNQWDDSYHLDLA